MSTPGVGVLISLTCASAIDDSGRFKWFKQRSNIGRLAARAGKNKAKVALACRLAMILHRMLVDGTPFGADKAAMVRRERQGDLRVRPNTTIRLDRGLVAVKMDRPGYKLLTGVRR